MRASPHELPAVGLPWLRRLRWLTLGALGLAVALQGGSGSLGLPVALLGVAAASNVALYALGARAARPPIVFAVMLLDTALLTGIVHFTGGPMNPFTALYFVHITLAAVLLDRRWVWLLLASSAAGFAALFIPTAGGHHHHHVDMTEHLRGMWIAFAVAAGLIAYFVSRLAVELRRRDAELAKEREQTARGRRVAALTGLAAGAAHELGTPIGSISLAASELDEQLEARGADAEVMADVRLIRREARRCREILDGLAVGAGELPGESLAPVSLAQLADAALARIRAEEAARVQVSAQDALVEVPPTALAIALASLLRNALDVDDGPISLDARVDDAGVTFRVDDHGPGMDREVLERVGEPFNTAREGGGMGLGLFLVHTLAQQLEGRLAIESAAGAGTSVRLVLPSHLVVIA